MPNQLADSTAVRAELRTLSRGSLLVIAERAAELIPEDQLSALLGDFVKLEEHTCNTMHPAAALFDDVREFFNAAMAGNYHEAVDINNRGRQEHSGGSDAFVAEFDRHLRRCILGASQGEFVGIRNSIELLFALLRHVDEGNDDVLFFADDGGSSNVGANWHSALPAYFKCLATTLPPAEFARTVVSTINEFVTYNRAHFLTAAHVVADDAQRAALRSLAPPRHDAGQGPCASAN